MNEHLHLSEIRRRCRESQNASEKRREEDHINLFVRLKPLDYVGATAIILFVLLILLTLKYVLP